MDCTTNLLKTCMGNLLLNSIDLLYKWILSTASHMVFPFPPDGQLNVVILWPNTIRNGKGSWYSYCHHRSQKWVFCNRQIPADTKWIVPTDTKRQQQQQQHTFSGTLSNCVHFLSLMVHYPSSLSFCSPSCYSVLFFFAVLATTMFASCNFCITN